MAMRALRMKLTIYQLISVPQLWLRAVGNDGTNEVPGTGGGNELLSQVAGLSIRDRVRCMVVWGGGSGLGYRCYSSASKGTI